MGIKKDAFFRHMVRVAVVTNNQNVLQEFETALAHATGNPVRAVAEVLQYPERFPALVQEANQKFKINEVPNWIQLAKAYSVESLREHTRPQEDVPDPLAQVRAERPPEPRAGERPIQAMDKVADVVSPDTFLTILRRESIDLYNIVSRNQQERNLLSAVLRDPQPSMPEKIERVKGILLRLVLLDYMRERQESRQLSKGLKEASSIRKDQIYRVIMSHLDSLDVR